MGFKTNFDQISSALPFSFCQLLSPTPQYHSSYLDFNTVGVSSLEVLASWCLSVAASATAEFLFSSALCASGFSRWCWLFTPSPCLL